MRTIYNLWQYAYDNKLDIFRSSAFIPLILVTFISFLFLFSLFAPFFWIGLFKRPKWQTTWLFRGCRYFIMACLCSTAILCLCFMPFDWQADISFTIFLCSFFTLDWSVFICYTELPLKFNEKKKN